MQLVPGKESTFKRQRSCSFYNLNRHKTENNSHGICQIELIVGKPISYIPMPLNFALSAITGQLGKGHKGMRNTKNPSQTAWPKQPFFGPEDLQKIDLRCVSIPCTGSADHKNSELKPYKVGHKNLLYSHNCSLVSFFPSIWWDGTENQESQSSKMSKSLYCGWWTMTKTKWRR